MIGDAYDGDDSELDDPQKPRIEQPLQPTGDLDFSDPKPTTSQPVVALAPAPPVKRHIEQALMEQANDAIAKGADPQKVTDALGVMVKHLRENPALVDQANDAIAKGADESAVAGHLYQLASTATGTPSPRGPVATPSGPAMAPAESTKARPTPAASDHSLMDDLNGAAGAIAQGASFGQAKRLAAGALALEHKMTGQPGGYDDALAEADRESKTFHADHPVADDVLRLGSGAAAGLAGGAVLGAGEAAADGAASVAPKALTLIQRMRAGIGPGFDVGAASGLASTDGSLDDRVKGAMAGGVAGAGVGAAAPVAGAVVKGVARTATPLLDAMKGAVLGGGDAAGGRVGSAVAAGAETTPGSLPNVANLLPGESRATDALLRRAQQSGVSLEDAKQAAADAVKSGKPVTAMEVFGQPVQRLGRYVSNTPSSGSADLAKSLDARGMGTPTRIIGDVEGAMGMPQQNLLDKADALIQSRRANAAPLYEKAYAAPPIDNPEVLSTLKLPAFQAAFKRGVRIAKLEGVTLPPLTKTEMIGGEPVTSLVPQSVQAIDYTKRGLDDLISSKLNSGAMGRTEARALRNRLSDMLDKVDEAVPEYAQARQQFAGDSRMMDALENGQNFLKTNGDQVARDYAKLSDSEQQTYRLGALGAIRDKVLGTQDQRDLAKSLTGTPDLRARLQTILGDGPELKQLMTAMDQERAMAQSRRVALSGSDTFRNAADQADVTGQPNSLIGMMISAHPGMALRHVVTKAANSAAVARMNGVGADVADALAPKLTASGSKLVDLIDQLIARSGQLSAQAARNKALTTGAAGAAAQIPRNQP